MSVDVKKIREALRLNQAEFGERIGRSWQSVQSYERGARISPPVQQRIIELAEAAGLGDLVDDFLAEHEADQGASPDLAASEQRHARWVRALCEILESRNQTAIRAVQHDLIAFQRLVRAERKAGKR